MAQYIVYIPERWFRLVRIEASNAKEALDIVQRTDRADLLTETACWDGATLEYDDTFSPSEHEWTIVNEESGTWGT